MRPQSRSKILLVEDEAIIAHAEEISLRSFGYEVIRVETGEEAIKAAVETEDIDLVLIDIDPGKGADGAEAAKRILDIKDLPLVFLASYYTPEIFEKVNEINCYGFTIKNQGDFFLKLVIDNAFKRFEAGKDSENKIIGLKLNEDKYRAAFMANPEAINIHDMNGQFVDVNRAFIEKTGYTSDDLIGRVSLQTGLWVNPEDRDRFAAPLLENGYVENMETLFRMKDGNIITAVMSGRIITINDEPHALVITRDINERKIIEEKIRESEEKYRATFITSPDSISINLMNGVYVDINDSFTRLTGFSRDEIIGKTVEETGLWAVHNDFLKFIEEINKSGFVENVESLFRCRDGSIKSSFISARIIKINGTPHVLSITRDFTERNKMLEALRKSEASLAEAQARAHLGSWEADFTKDTSVWSDEMFRIFGISPESGPLKNAEQLHPAIHPEDLDLVKNNEYRIVKEKRPFISEYRIIRRNDNAVRWCESFFNPIINEKEEVTGVSGTVLDITERKLASESLKESEEKFRSIEENISDMIFITDADGFITYLSDSSMGIFGYRPDEMVKHFFGEYLADGELEKAFPKFEHAIRTGTPDKGIDLIAKNKDGKTFYAELNSSIIKKDNQVIGTLGLIRDITERKISEDQIKKLLKEKELLLKRDSSSRKKQYEYNYEPPFSSGGKSERSRSCVGSYGREGPHAEYGGFV